MKDRELRYVVALLSKRVNYLLDDIVLLKKPHPEGCRCRLCKPRADPFALRFWGEDMNDILDGEIK